MKQNITLGIIIVFSIVLATFIAGTMNQTPSLNFSGADGAHVERQCSTTSTAQVEIGNENSVTILATSTGSGRAWAKIETLEVLAAGDTVGTSTVFLNFDGGN